MSGDTKGGPHVFRPFLVGLALALFVWCGLASEARACLGHYCSPEQAATESSLIFVGKVESVQVLPVKNKEWGDETPSVANVKILRVLHGSHGKPRVKVRSGPVASCAPYAVHYQFSIGKTSIFLVSVCPKKGEIGLYTGRRLLRPTDLELVEAVLNRAVVHKTTYLERIRKDSPKAYAAAEDLYNKLSEASKDWPSLAYLYEEEGEVREMRGKEKVHEQARNALIEELRKSKPQVLRTAVAMDWLSHDPNSFSRQDVWKEAAREVMHDKRVCESERGELRIILQRAGVSKKHIDEYLKSIPDKALQTGVGFPVRAPSPWNYGKKKGDILTTDFILRYHCFDRGGMFPAYGMGFDQLASLNPDRLREIIPAMYASKHKKLSLVAHRAIERMPGTDFVGLLFKQARDGNKHALSALPVKDNTKETERRFKALLKHSQKHSDYWRLLRLHEFFEKVAIEEAIALLEKPEKQSAEAEGTQVNTIDREKADLHAYLKAAMAIPGDRKTDDLTPAQYREWFQKYPPARRRW